MSSVSFYRKYRPKNFSDVCGQNHVKETLKNAVNFDRISHAYLFTGPRGIGKTTIARIFAKAVNCKKPNKGEPDNKCASCNDIGSEKSLDLIEIDGASNRGIDEIRELREKIKFAPSNNKYKIFIIDEVHMLTKEAFNALLKTLEEPPAHAIFIFATTEIHKIPATVLSRCQRFNFSKLTITEIIAELRRISKIEKIDIKDESLYMIASYAEGAMRDALSMLDQMSSFGNKKITEDMVKEMLGVAEVQSANKILKSIINRKTSVAIETLTQVMEEGIDVSILVDTLIDKLRNILFIKIGNINQVNFFNEDEEKLLTELSGLTEESRIVELINEFTIAKQKIKFTNPPQLAVELAITKLSQKDILNTIEDEQKKVEIQTKAPGNIKLSENQKTSFFKKENTHNDSKEGYSKEPKEIKSKETTDKVDNSFIINIKNKWPKIVDGLKIYNHSIALCLKTANPEKIENGILHISFQFPLHRDKIQEMNNKRLVEDEIKKQTGKLVVIRCFVGTKHDKVEPQAIDEALNIFEGEVIDE